MAKTVADYAIELYQAKESVALSKKQLAASEELLFQATERFNAAVKAEIERRIAE